MMQKMTQNQIFIIIDAKNDEKTDAKPRNLHHFKQV